ncbi:MAG: pyridoxal-phosphate dependent enzyme [Clostridiales Family XIII bacterium]|jgi:cysteine synthase|nr:pyridoxal-phosphate dependent enzyme [Clostridiales Family XIII bacterium]
MIDLTIHEEVLAKNIENAREKGIILPTFKQMRDPAAYVPEEIQEKLKGVGLWDIDSLNLFRVTWRNEPVETGGGFGGPNYIELPRALTGVKARIICMVGKWFPTGCHKVGASYGCLVPTLVTGRFDAMAQKAAWPSTGNYCRGGAFNSKLLGVDSIAILPEGMSRERFEWLSKVATEVIATPGTESNVKEIFDKTRELKQRPDVMIFNQFEEMGNYLWHYRITAAAIEAAYEDAKQADSRFAGACFNSGSAGTIGSGDYLKQRYPESKVAVGEALQCPTILENGFGAHRIEGIGDKHIPWIHNVRNTDLVADIDDADCMAILRLFNEPAGREFLAAELHLLPEELENLSLMGISGIANMLTAIKFAKYYELTERDVVATVLTDSMDMYGSRLVELREAEGDYTPLRAAADLARSLHGQNTAHLAELTYADRKRVHNLKYFTWVEQQGRTAEELSAQWYDQDATFAGVQNQVDALDALIEDFNKRARG